MSVTPALLVADDDQVARELLAEVLGREGYRVRIAAGGAECLRLVEADGQVCARPPVWLTTKVPGSLVSSTARASVAMTVTVGT